MTSTPIVPEEDPSEENPTEAGEAQTPDHTVHRNPSANKVSQFGRPHGQNSMFGKTATHFQPPSKQRTGRAAGRGR